MSLQAIAIGKKQSGTRPMVWLLLAAFLLQSFITQTHFHSVFAASETGYAKTTPLHGKSPASGDLKDCPFCQAVSHSGVFFTPSAPGALLPVIAVAAAAASSAAGAIESLSSHSWYSRGPPQH